MEKRDMLKIPSDEHDFCFWLYIVYPATFRKCVEEFNYEKYYRK